MTTKERRDLLAGACRALQRPDLPPQVRRALERVVRYGHSPERIWNAAVTHRVLAEMIAHHAGERRL